MKYFNGMEKTDYQDVMRALGLWCDVNRLRYIRMMEVDDGILVQGTVANAAGKVESRMVEKLFTDDDMHRILVEAYALRTKAAAQATPPR